MLSQNSRIKFLFLAMLMALSFSVNSCDSLKGAEMSISAEPASIAAGGYEYAEITVHLKKSNEAYEGQSIMFNTDNGSFAQSEELTDTMATTDSEGNATVKLYSAMEQGQATVIATYSDPDAGTDITENITVLFGPPSANSLPMDGNFNLDCDYFNVGALTNISKPDIQVPCQVTARNIDGNSIPAGSLTLHFFAEAGELNGYYDEGDEEYKIVYSVRGGEARPVDVEPMSGEPERACGGLVCNPRDGLVTIMVVTAGAEKFEDRNDNGEWDDTEPFDDLPEPFLDANDNGEYDLGEQFFDSNNDGEYSEANGIYDSETYIYAIYKLVWTGRPEENETAAAITHSPASTLIPNGGSITVTARLVDENLNPVAVSAETGDMLNFMEVSGNLIATQPASTPGSFYLDYMDAWQLDFDTWDFLGFDETAADFTCKFDDADPSPDGDPMTYTIGVDALLSPGPEGIDGEFVQYNFSFQTTVSGTVQ